MPKKQLSILPQDVSINITKKIRESDPDAIIYPASIVLSEASKHFTKEEISHIKQQQKDLFEINSKNIRTLVIQSSKLSQDKISSLLYFEKHTENQSKQ